MYFPYYDYYSRPYMGGSQYILSVAALVSLLGLYLIIAWVFRSIGLYHMAKNRGISHAWFAWVPVLSNYIIGRLINNKVVLGDDIVVNRASFLLPVLSYLSISLAVVSTDYETNPLTVIFSSLVWIFYISALWRLFKIYRPKSRVSFTGWSIVLLSAGFFIFAIRDDKPFDELEPNKVYENYYGGKQTITNEYESQKSAIRVQEKEDENALRDEYKDLLNQRNLTDSQRDKIKDDYYQERQTIRDEANESIKEESKEYQEALDNFDTEITEHLDPVVTKDDDGVVISPKEEPQKSKEDDEVISLNVEEQNTEDNNINFEEVDDLIDTINQVRQKQESKDE